MRKHIQRKYRLLREKVGKEGLEIKYCKIELQLTHTLTNPLTIAKFEGPKGFILMRRLVNLN